MFSKVKTNFPQREQLRLLTSGQSVSTPIAIVAVSSLGISALSFLLQIINYGATSSLVRKEPPSLVQLSGGDTISVKAVDGRDRSPEVIKKFVSDTLVKIFNWDGLIKSINIDGETTTIKDSGVNIKLEKGTGKVTTSSWDAAFALSENQNFRASFLKKLAELTPGGVFNGSVQVALVPRHVSQPRKIADGKWEVDVVATLVTFRRDDNAGKGIAFNKTITVGAVSTPQVPLPNSTNLANKIYAARRSGLEIIEIVDLDLQKK